MKKRNFLEEEYKKAFIYLKDIKNFIWIVIGIFILFALLGFFVPVPESVSTYIFEYIRNLLAQTEHFTSYFQWFGFIFLNNVLSSFVSSFGGIILGIHSILASIINGFLVGFVSKFSVVELGVVSLWKLLPHGVFELPAIFISFATGLKLGTFVFQKKKMDSLALFLKNTFRIFLLVVLPLLFIAALIESALIFFG